MTRRYFGEVSKCIFWCDANSLLWGPQAIS